MKRRALLGGLLAGSGIVLVGCGGRQAPLAHLAGPAWVKGAYALYAGEYAEVQTSSEQRSTGAYALFAQRGVTALDGLQQREVPFFLRADPSAGAFRVEREVPERLTFTASMTAADRAAAEASWKLARDHIHSDYEEIRRLNWALSVLWGELVRARHAIEAARREQYRLVAQLDELEGDPSALPFDLPRDVAPADYQEILLLLVERLEHDRARLEVLEGHIVAVGLTARATDANSATMAASLRKVLVAVVADGLTPARPASWPSSDEERAKLLEGGRALRAAIARSAGFATWQREEEAKSLEAFGSFLGVLDQVTGIPTSPIFGTVVKLWRGDDDYLGYLRTAAGLVPNGEVRATLEQAVDLTDTARRLAPAAQALATGDTGEAIRRGEGYVLNAGSRFARDRAGKQLAFFRDAAEVDVAAEALAGTPLATLSLASVPGAPR